MLYQNISSNKRKSVWLIIIFLGLITAIGYVFSLASETGYLILVIALIFAIFMTMTSWYAGDQIALKTARAIPLTRQDDPELYRLVENLSITAGLPMPKLYLIQDQTLNAFATGRDPEHASLAVTDGLKNRLTKTELEGVIAHELSHIGNYDTRYLMLTLFLVGFVALVSDFFLRAQFFGGNRGRKDGRAGTVILIAGLVLAILAPIAAKLLQLAVSRKREFLADASGVLLTRYPEGLASALKKISAANTPLQSANQATAPLYFSNPFGISAKRKFSSLFSTHPPIKDRIKAITQR